MTQRKVVFFWPASQLGVLSAFACVLLAMAFRAEQSKADGWRLFSRELAQAQEDLQRGRDRLKSLGPLVLRQTAPQSGAQSNMRPELPPQAPWVQIDLGDVESFDQIMIVPALGVTNNEEATSYAFPERLRVDVSNSREFDTFELLYDSADEPIDRKSPFPLVVETSGTEARYLRLTVLELAQVTGRWTFALAEVMVIRGDRNIALNRKVSMTEGARIPPIWKPAFLVDGRSPLGPPILPAKSDQELPRFDGVFLESTQQEEELWFQIDLGQVEAFDCVRLFPVHARLGADVPGYAFPSRFRVECSDDTSFNKSRTLFQTKSDFGNPGTCPVVLTFGETKARCIRIVSEQSSLLPMNKAGFAEAQVMRGSQNISYGKLVSSPYERENSPLDLLVDGVASYGPIAKLDDWSERWASVRKVQSDIRLAEQRIERDLPVAQSRAAWTALALGGLFVLSVTLSIGWQRKLRMKKATEFRMHLARNLHDDIGSNLAAIARIGEVGGAITEDPAAQEDWQAVRELAGECTEAMRETLWLLGGPRRTGGTLIEELKTIASRMLVGIDLSWNSESEDQGFTLDEETEREIVLVFKAMLANIAGSSNASRVVIERQVSDSRWRLCVEDNGTGFDVAAWENRMQKKGMGLESMRARMKRVGGLIHIDSVPGAGARLMIDVLR
ncbi:MAG: histidine kinase [Planctomycetota bacterium]